MTTPAGATPDVDSDAATANEDVEAQNMLADATGGDDQPEEARAEDAEQLGDRGKRALEAMKEQRRKAREDLAAERAKRGQYEEFLRGLGLDPEVLAAKAAERADGDADAIRRDAVSKANRRILRSEVKAAAAGKLANPALAVKLLDLSKFEVDDDGEVDQAELAEAIDELLRDEPYLAAAAPKRFQGGADQGARKKAKPASLDERIAEAEGKGDWAEARRLKSTKLTQSAS